MTSQTKALAKKATRFKASQRWYSSRVSKKKRRSELQVEDQLLAKIKLYNLVSQEVEVALNHNPSCLKSDKMNKMMVHSLKAVDSQITSKTVNQAKLSSNQATKCKEKAINRSGKTNIISTWMPKSSLNLLKTIMVFQSKVGES